MKHLFASLLLSILFSVIAIGQTEIKYLNLVDEDTQYYRTNPVTLEREPVEVDRRIGMMLSVPVFGELYRKMENRSITFRPKTLELYSELSREGLISLIYLEENQSGEYLMLRSSESLAVFQSKTSLFMKTVERVYGIKLKLVEELPMPVLELPKPDSIAAWPSWTRPPKNSIITAQSQANTLAVSRVAREEIPQEK